MAQQSMASKVTLVLVAALAVGLLTVLGNPPALILIEAGVLVLALALAFANRGTWGQGMLFLMSASVVIFYGVYGYFVEAIVRIGFSILQVSSVLVVLVVCTTIDIVIFRGAPLVGEIRWGKIPERAQYILFLLAPVRKL